MADYCPTFTEYLISCNSDVGLLKRWDGEEFGSSESRCFNTNDMRPYCLKTRCNEQRNKIEIMVEDRAFATCEFDGQLIEIQGKLIECPKFAVLCPE